MKTYVTIMKKLFPKYSMVSCCRSSELRIVSKGNPQQSVEFPKPVNGSLWSNLSDESVECAINTIKPYCPASRQKRLLEVLSQRTTNIRFVYENPSNPENAFAALRNLDAFGVQDVDIIMNDDMYSPGWLRTRKLKMRSAIGSQQWLSVTHHTSTSECLSKLRAGGYLIASTDLHGDSVPVTEVAWSEVCKGKKVAVVMGNEESGISPTVREAADMLVVLPMRGFAESLNLSSATAALCAVLQGQGMMIPDLSPALKRRILLTWMSRSVPSSLELLRRAGFDVIGKRRSLLFDRIGPFSTKP